MQTLEGLADGGELAGARLRTRVPVARLLLALGLEVVEEVLVRGVRGLPEAGALPNRTSRTSIKN